MGMDPEPRSSSTLVNLHLEQLVSQTRHVVIAVVRSFDKQAPFRAEAKREGRRESLAAEASPQRKNSD